MIMQIFTSDEVMPFTYSDVKNFDIDENFLTIELKDGNVYFNKDIVHHFKYITATPDCQ